MEELSQYSEESEDAEIFLFCNFIEKNTMTMTSISTADFFYIFLTVFTETIRFLIPETLNNSSVSISVFFMVFNYF